MCVCVCVCVCVLNFYVTTASPMIMILSSFEIAFVFLLSVFFVKTILAFGYQVNEAYIAVRLFSCDKRQQNRPFINSLIVCLDFFLITKITILIFGLCVAFLIFSYVLFSFYYLSNIHLWNKIQHSLLNGNPLFYSSLISMFIMKYLHYSIICNSFISNWLIIFHN